MANKKQQTSSKKKQKTSVNHQNGMWKNDKAPIVPVTILTGFLGSGKTGEKKMQDLQKGRNDYQ